jgi:hypothetical protein
LLVDHVADQSSTFVCYGSRVEQPRRVRAFIDLAVQRLTDNPDYVLTAKELQSAQANGRKAFARR